MQKTTLNGLDLYCLKTTKFKTLSFGLVFSFPLDGKYLAERSIITNLLPKTTKEEPSEQMFSLHLNDMYDLTINSSTNKRGLVHTMTFVVNMIDEHYLKTNEELFSKAMQTLKMVLLEPNLEKGFFKPNLWQAERDLIVNDIKSIYNQKASYALLRLGEIMYAGEKYAFTARGSLADYEAVTAESLMAAYQEMLMADAKFFLVGNLPLTKLLKELKTVNFPFKTKAFGATYIDYEEKCSAYGQKVIENSNTNQSVICMSYRTPIHLDHDLYPAMIVFNGILGGFFHSELYRVVREQNSLAYYVSSTYFAFKGVLGIISGINAKDYEQVLALIESEVAKIQQGKVNQETFDLTQKALISGIYEGDDTLTGLFQSLMTLMETPKYVYNKEELVNKVNSVTIADIIKCSQTLQLDTVYFLKGTGKVGDENHEDDEI